MMAKKAISNILRPKEGKLGAVCRMKTLFPVLLSLSVVIAIYFSCLAPLNNNSSYGFKIGVVAASSGEVKSKHSQRNVVEEKRMPRSPSGGPPVEPLPEGGKRWMDILKIGNFLDGISKYDYHLTHRLPLVKKYTNFSSLKKYPVINEYSMSIYKKLEEIGELILSAANPLLTKADRATDGWFLTDATSAFIATSIYVAFAALAALGYFFYSKNIVKKASGKPEVIAPKALVSKFMSEPILIFQCFYNILQVVLCSYMVLRVIDEYQMYRMTPMCNNFNASNPAIARLLWIFYISKILDFCDTFFIVVRRKWRQLSFLHVYHHSTIFLFYWVNINVAYDGDIYLTILLNAFVHCVMYSYYLLRTLDIYVPRPLKQLVTRIQMIQFCIMEFQAVYNLFNMNRCPFPNRVTAAYSLYILSLLALFQTFSTREYGDKRIASSTVNQSGGKKLKGA